MTDSDNNAASSADAQFYTKVGIRNRVNRFSDSVLSILTSESNEKMRAAPPRPATVVISKVVVMLFLISLVLILSTTVMRLFALVRPAGVKLSRRLGIKSKYIYASSASYLSIEDYPTVLVNESKPFSAAQRAGALDHDESQSIIITPYSEDEVVRSRSSDEMEETAARLIVLTMNRASSLGRLLKSLVSASYGDDVVDLDIWIDRKKGSPINEDVLAFARNTTWTRGTKTIHKRTVNAGLYQQWIYTWNITSETTEFAVILEDDLEVSPAFYEWLRLARAAYAQDPEVAAFTLQRSTLRPRQRKGIASGNLNISKEHHVFKYRLLGTWGFAPQRDHWVEFRKWFELCRARDDKPYVDGLITTDWYKSQERNGFAPNMWSQWWIKFVDEKNYFTVTPHLPDGTTLAANWKEPGLHFAKASAQADFSVFRGNSDQFVMPDNPIHVDWDGLIIKQKSSHSA